MRTRATWQLNKMSIVSLPCCTRTVHQSSRLLIPRYAKYTSRRGIFILHRREWLRMTWNIRRDPKRERTCRRAKEPARYRCIEKESRSVTHTVLRVRFRIFFLFSFFPPFSPRARARARPNRVRTTLYFLRRSIAPATRMGTAWRCKTSRSRSHGSEKERNDISIGRR